jgi:hypothetical protein
LGVPEKNTWASESLFLASKGIQTYGRDDRDESEPDSGTVIVGALLAPAAKYYQYNMRDRFILVRNAVPPSPLHPRTARHASGTIMDCKQIEDRYDPSCCAPESAPVSLDVVTSDCSRRAIPGVFRLFDGKSLIVNTTERISPSSSVAAQSDDVLFVGEVLACEQETDMCWVVRIRVKHTLSSLQSLMRLHNALLGGPGPDLEVEHADLLRRESADSRLLHK